MRHMSSKAQPGQANKPRSEWQAANSYQSLVESSGNVA
ncbi:hypothetical protein MY10362_009094 [Beauveria mimosiformis]